MTKEDDDTKRHLLRRPSGEKGGPLSVPVGEKARDRKHSPVTQTALSLKRAEAFAGVTAALALPENEREQALRQIVARTLYAGYNVSADSSGILASKLRAEMEMCRAKLQDVERRVGLTEMVIEQLREENARLRERS